MRWGLRNRVRILGDLLRLQDGHIGKTGLICRDYDLLFCDELGSFQLDMHLFILFCLDGHQRFDAVAVQALALDRHIIFAGGYSGDGDAMCAVCSEYLVNDACAGVVVLVKNDQYGILVVGSAGDVELEADGTGIDRLFCFYDGAAVADGLRTRSCLRSCCEEQAEEVKGEFFSVHWG